jgi:hypothetical protein
MKRRLALRDRATWCVAGVALAVVVYVFLPIWVVVGAVVVLIGTPLLVRRRRRQHARR